MVFAGCALPAATLCKTGALMLMNTTLMLFAGCALLLMLMMLTVLARDHQWAADAHDALCWLRPVDS